MQTSQCGVWRCPQGTFKMHGSDLNLGIKLVPHIVYFWVCSFKCLIQASWMKVIVCEETMLVCLEWYVHMWYAHNGQDMDLNQIALKVQLTPKTKLAT